MVLVGDSRVWRMYQTLYGRPAMDLYTRDGNGYVWLGRIGAGIYWLSTTAVARVDAEARFDAAIVIMLGVNDAFDLGRAGSYVSFLNAKASQWRAKGASVTYVSVLPVGKYPGDDNHTDEQGRVTTNSRHVRPWNETLRNGLSSDVAYLDGYSAFAGNYASNDAVHFDGNTDRRIYSYLRGNVIC